MEKLARIRAVEWALLGFTCYVGVRAGPMVFSRWSELAGLRTVTVACVMGVVVAIGQVRRLRKSQWPSGVSQAPWAFLGMIAIAPMLFALTASVTTGTLRNQVFTLATAQVLPVVANVALRLVGFGLVPLICWLGLALHVVRHQTVRAGALAQEAATELLTQAREWGPLLLILSGYAFMAALFDGVIVSADDTLAAIDRRLFMGHDPLDLLEGWHSRPLSEWLAFAYSFYAVLYPLVLGAAALRRGTPAIREASFVIGLALLLAYVLYTLVPVRGPILSRTFATDLELYTIGPIKEALMDATRITYDCFPSMHTCTSLLLGWLAWRHVRVLFWLTLPMILSIPLACVYLRYHYVADVIAGGLLAGVMVVLTRLRNRAATL